MAPAAFAAPTDEMRAFNAMGASSCVGQSAKLDFIARLGGCIAIGYVPLMVLFKASVVNVGDNPDHAQVVLITATIFGAFTFHSVTSLSRWDVFRQSKAPEDDVKRIAVSGARQADLAILIVSVVSFVGFLSHLSMALAKMPVANSGFGRRQHAARWAEWCTAVPLLMLLMRMFDDAVVHDQTLGAASPSWQARAAAKARQRLAPPGGPLVVMKWFWTDEAAAGWRSFLSLTLSTYLGAVFSLAGDLFPFWLNAVLLAGSIALFCPIFFNLWRQLEWARHVRDTAEGATLVEQMGHVVALERSERRVSLCFSCSVTWSLFALVYVGGALRLYSERVEMTALDILDVMSKALYAAALGKSHLESMSPAKTLERLLSLERFATDQRRAFLRYVMHEVRVPLNTVHLGIHAIHVELQTAAEHRLPAPVLATLTDVEAILGEVKQSVTVMSATLDDVLSFAAIEEGRMDLNWAPFCPSKTFRAALDMFAGAAAAKGITLVLEADPAHADFLRGDGRKLAAVVHNFVSNAIKFSATGTTILVTASARPLFDLSRESSRQSTKIGCDDDTESGLPKSVRREKRGFAEVSQSTRSIPTPLALDSEEESQGDALCALLRVEVKDAGVGIREEDQKRLFTAFSQIRPGELQDGRGSGLGLAIAKHVVQLHGGTIGCRSRLGEGSTFSFSVVLNVASRADFRVEASAASPRPNAQKTARYTPSEGSDEVSAFFGGSAQSESSRPPSFLESRPPSFESPRPASFDIVVNSGNVAAASGARQRFALVADDVHINRKLLARVLQKEGFDCDHADTGAAAVEVYRQAAASGKAFDLICMDAVMPVMGGLDATKIIRADGYTGLLVGCTGNALEEDIRDFIAAGADHVLTKPISIQKLRSLYKERRAKDPPVETPAQCG
ncbi:hypothetical protein M885DRAFT_96678 [Pelagophyceae sp. CCMP2097]|nr:hypothetical protein M885DRAFT_96678 [Pelagophyceae sp. CCMP2097]